MRRLITIALASLLVLAACGDDESGGTTTPTLPDGSVVAEFRTPDGVTFKVVLSGDAAVQARDAFANGEYPGFPNGKIVKGDGGVNAGHDWHLVEVELTEMAMEVCDGTASYVDDLGYDEFVSQHGDRFCPWAAELVGLDS